MLAFLFDAIRECEISLTLFNLYISWNFQGCFIIQLSISVKATSQERCLHQFMTTALDCENTFSQFLFLSKQLIYYILFILSCQELFSSFFTSLDVFRSFSAMFYMLPYSYFYVNIIFSFFSSMRNTFHEFP